MSRYSSAAQTHVGMKRTNNEDAFSIREDLGLYLVADGMGGHSCGEVASRIAVDEIVRFCEAPTAGVESTWPYEYDNSLSFEANRLRTAISLANDQIQAYAAEHAESRGMGTTVVALQLHDDRAILAHVGDSRAYLFRGGTLQSLTSDHSWVNEQVKMGFLTLAEAQRHPFRNVITKALGSKGDASAEVSELPLMAGDTLLLCSDGLTSMVEDDLLVKLFSAEADLASLCAALISAANQAGGEDNITVTLVRREK